MIAVAVACCPSSSPATDRAAGRAALFLFYYAAYLGWIVLEATGSPALATLRNALFFALPLTAVTLGVCVARALRARRARRGPETASTPGA